MKKRILFVVILIPFTMFGQTVKKPVAAPLPPAISTSIYSLLDIGSLQKIETQDLSLLYTKSSKNGINTYFKPLLNNWYYFFSNPDGYQIIKLRDKKWIDDGSQKRIKVDANLNDTIFVLRDGRMLDISKDSFVESDYFSSRVLTLPTEETAREKSYNFSCILYWNIKLQ
jgi:hypothetical protein